MASADGSFQWTVLPTGDRWRYRLGRPDVHTRPRVSARGHRGHRHTENRAATETRSPGDTSCMATRPTAYRRLILDRFRDEFSRSEVARAGSRVGRGVALGRWLIRHGFRYSNDCACGPRWATEVQGRWAVTASAAGPWSAERSVAGTTHWGVRVAGDSEPRQVQTGAVVDAGTGQCSGGWGADCSGAPEHLIVGRGWSSGPGVGQAAAAGRSEVDSDSAADDPELSDGRRSHRERWRCGVVAHGAGVPASSDASAGSAASLRRRACRPGRSLLLELCVCAGP